MARQRNLVAAASSARRESGRDAGTRQRLLETAGRVFADKGLDSATGREICERAGVNTAAINYHFGGFARLYEAVLTEALERVPNRDVLSAALDSAADDQAKLRAIIGLAVDVLTGPPARSWTVRLLVREAAAPSAAFERLTSDSERRAKLSLLKRTIGHVMKLPENHPVAEQGCFAVAALCQVMLIGDRNVVKRNYPGLDLSTQGASELADRLTIFAMAGLKALAAQTASE